MDPKCHEKKHVSLYIPMRAQRYLPRSTLQHLVLARSCNMQWNSTATIIAIAVGGSAVTFIVVLTIWLCCRRRKRNTAPKSRVRYSKLQKKSPSNSPNLKHTSMKTTSDTSRNSSLSLIIPEITQQTTRDSTVQAYQHQSQTEYQSHTSNLQRYPSATSNYSFRPEHLSKGAFHTSGGPTLTIPQPLLSRPKTATAPSSNLSSRPVIPERRASASDLNRNTSIRVANYHTDAEYTDLIGDDLVELLGDRVPPPSIPRKSSQRGSAPSELDGSAVAPSRVISEEIRVWEKAPMLEGGLQAPQQHGRWRTNSWYTNGS